MDGTTRTDFTLRAMILKDGFYFVDWDFFNELTDCITQIKEKLLPCKY